MDKDYPISIKRENEKQLKINWASDFVAIISLKTLRDNCPCSYCGEAMGQKPKDMPENLAEALGMYTLTAIEPIGNYAIKPKWKDNHNEGFYAWDLLKELCLKYGLNDFSKNIDNLIHPENN